MPHSFSTRSRKRHSRAGVSRIGWAVASLAAIVGLILLSTSQAATHLVSGEAEGGRITVPATAVAATGASGGSAVRFGSSAPAANTALLEGSFVQPWLAAGWDQTRFAAELQYMKDVKMDHLIWQWTADSTAGKMITYYPTGMSGFRQHGSNDAVGASLAAARAKGMKVWLGLNWTDNWWDKYANDNTWLTREFSISRATADELWGRYKGQYADTIAGFYMTMEVDNYNFGTTALQDRMASVYKTTTDSIHANTGKPVMVAPFFNATGGQTAAQYAAMWGRIMTVAPIDVVAVQDGIGVNHATVANIGSWLAPLRQSIKSARPATQFWVDLETFTQTSADSFVPAPFSRVLDQLNAQRQYVDKFTTYSFVHYGSPNQAGNAQYQAWKAYSDTK